MKPHMSRLFSMFLLASALLLVSCGTSSKGSRGDQEVHNIGYGKVSKNSSSGSINTVERDKTMENNNISVLDMLRRVPGVEIGGGNSITIRGVTSLSLSSEPLFVLDGVPVGTGYQAVSGMNPNDIKRISVLKGSSASIYGSQGANGVIVIESKTGKN
jgi:iron complex outermembrane receptor protein